MAVMEPKHICPYNKLLWGKKGEVRFHISFIIRLPLAKHCIYSFIHSCIYMRKTVSPSLTQRNGVHAHTEGVETSVTLVTEHHLLLMVRLLAHGARLALHALPGIHLDLGHQLHTHIQAGRVT